MLCLNDCCAGYAQDILHHVSLSISQGEVTTLIGPNGCGKTTLLRVFARGIAPRSGSLQVDGKDAAQYSPREYAQAVAYLPQSRPIPQITAAALVAHGRFPHLPFPRKLTASDHEKIDDAITALHLTQDRDRKLSDLSGGERQRVYLAMLLAQDSRYFLLDEPTTYLDPRYQFEILSLLRSFSREGRGVCLVLHDLANAMSFSDRIVVMQNGTIRAVSTPQELLNSDVIFEVFGIRIRAITDTDGTCHYVCLPQ